MNEQIKQLKSLDLARVSITTVQKLLEDLPFCPVLCSLPMRHPIQRARVGVYYTREELTYPPANKVNVHMRANWAGHPLFYGVVTSDPLEALIIAGMEVVPLNNNTQPFIDVTIAEWNSTRKLRLLSVLHPCMFNHIGNNPLLKDLLNAYYQTLNGMESSLREEYDEGTKFIANEFSKIVQPENNHDYLISATFVMDTLFNATEIDGILFPSVKTRGEIGVNIVLRPSVVDEYLEMGEPFHHGFIRKEILQNY